MSRLGLLYCIDSVGQDAGSEKQVAELIRRLDPERFEIHLCCFEESARLLELRRFCHTLLLPVPSFYRPRGLRTIRRLRRYLHAQGIELMHTFLVDAHIAGVLAARGSPCRTVVGSRRNLGYWMKPYHRPLFRMLNRYTTRVLANCEAVRRQVIETEGLAAQKVDVIHNGVDLARYAPGRGDPAVAAALGVPAGARVVGIVANLRPVKNHQLFLEAARVVAARLPDVAFLLVGRGLLRAALAEQARRLGIAERVFFSDGHGPVADYLGCMQLGCLASSSEGFANTLLEYMAAGLPVVATDVGGTREAVLDGKTGLLVPPGDRDALAAAIIRLLADRRLRQEMGRAGRRRCEAHFEIGAAVERHAAYYEALSAGSSASRA